MEKPVPVPTALTNAARKALCKAMRLGMPLKDCAAAAAVGYTSLKKWMAAGKEHPDTPQGALVAELEAADAQFVESCMDTLTAAHKGALEDCKPDWKAAAWLLERRRPGDFSQRQEQHITVSQEEGVPNFNVTPRRHKVPSIDLDTTGNGKADGEAG